MLFTISACFSNYQDACINIDGSLLLWVSFLVYILIEHREETDISFELIWMFAVCKTPINGYSNPFASNIAILFVLNYENHMRCEVLQTSYKRFMHKLLWLKKLLPQDTRHMSSEFVSQVWIDDVNRMLLWYASNIQYYTSQVISPKRNF